MTTVRLMWKANGIALGAALLLASCGRPDASGVYLATSDRMVTLIQLVVNKDGALAGRLEQVSVKADGSVKDETMPLDGAASGRDLVFKPTSIWFGGLQASGSVSGNRLTLSGKGFSLEASRSTLEDYQAAVSRLKSVAANDRQKIAETRAAQARQAAEARAMADAANKVAAIERDTTRIRDDAAKLDAAIARAPDFGQRAAANTARIARMLQFAPRLSSLQRGQLGVEANQVQIDTNQIEIARSQYAMGLNQIIQDAASTAEPLQRFCNSPQGAQFAQSCGPAKAAMADFAASVARGRGAFSGYKEAVQSELDRQAALIRQMNG